MVMDLRVMAITEEMKFLPVDKISMFIILSLSMMMTFESVVPTGPMIPNHLGGVLKQYSHSITITFDILFLISICYMAWMAGAECKHVLTKNPKNVRFSRIFRGVFLVLFYRVYAYFPTHALPFRQTCILRIWYLN